ncbi:superoxide dismutase family protein [Prosthecomicrobium pneumaticum]|uniref:Superoxide dismutase [Cu-Zn] n=1 Tax=Prosthecomicrobium pneumaticum TaxID=81895 RepID=A0A7W9CV28_9HYPH|nr:superoxide dismutase family protein [Prosthecomicrobium pneumaticum]MBB5752103.1 Cu-Zn family superoxide dismutase [Prosthecomicrobium pneumaticum]
MRPVPALFAATALFTLSAAGALAQGNLPVERDELPQPAEEGRPGTSAEDGGPVRATARLVGPDGTEHGIVRFAMAQVGVVITVAVKGLPAGTHAIHIHEKGACTPDPEAAGGHFNPTGTEHGVMNRDGPHVGDLPNLHVPESGTLTVEYFAPLITLAHGETGALLDEDGAAVVIHAGPDDYHTDPAGGSGDRIACGAIEAAAADE